MHKKASIGDMSDPKSFLNNLIAFKSSILLQLATPPTTSPWPFIYLVIEWSEISAPNSKGLIKTAEVKVASTTSFAFFSLHNFEMAQISVTLQVGLAGVSK